MKALLYNFTRKRKLQFIKLLYQLNPFSYIFWFSGNLNTLKRKMKLYFSLFPTKKKKYEAELSFVLNHSNSNQLHSYVFPYSFVSAYKHENIPVFKDTGNGLFYVIHQNKKLYYSRDYTTESSVRENYNCILIEQDERSPHRYTTANFDVEANDIVVDIGAAEGNFSLEIVERVGSLYIFETNQNWVEALQATFAPWQHKVTISNKFVSDIDSDTCISLKSFLNGHIQANFIKMDVEGSEVKILRNAKDMLKTMSKLKLAVCTYHNSNDAKQVEQIMKQCNYTYCFSSGYMLFIHSKLLPPYFRRGLIRAQNQ